MNFKLVIEATLLLLAAGLALACAIGMALMRDAFDRLHFVGPLSIFGPVLIAAAIVLEEALSTNGVKTIIAAGLLLVTSPILTHATSRAARVRQYGHWQALPAEEVDTD